ncbi:hypothetical protein EDI_028550 [Entamoeba dispar SAW760]|uniref:Uncharacterized protein n=1 Tax=Entamoeba dispar (strain ATCC PRA-260 / SAW760) TaxID=370354 RepID=B0ES55_ENTDS|nr:uncharacterized protein EDI_028550 [Entamoeba dispar SAW760]EDR22631.1 hypothetical protein EDI_028550 [Entamoeba dispar SAW760]|eukprot:EDR22631.1 hypothetical protein EDI_028550 [Entamoeba dispar SAW760]
MTLFITLFIVFVVAKEPQVAPVIGFSNSFTFSHTGANKTLDLKTLNLDIEKVIESDVDQVVFFIDYNINTFDFEEFTKYNGYTTLRNYTLNSLSSFEAETTTISFVDVLNNLELNITNNKIHNRNVYLYTDSATLTDTSLFNFAQNYATVKILNQDDFTSINKSALVVIAFRNVGSFDRLKLNDQIIKNYFNQNSEYTNVAFYGSLHLVEKDTITSATWYNTATLSILFVVFILLILLWFMMHFMLAVQSIGPAVFAKPKTD